MTTGKWWAKPKGRGLWHKESSIKDGYVFFLCGRNLAGGITWNGLGEPPAGRSCCQCSMPDYMSRRKGKATYATDPR